MIKDKGKKEVASRIHLLHKDLEDKIDGSTSCNVYFDAKPKEVKEQVCNKLGGTFVLKFNKRK